MELDYSDTGIILPTWWQRSCIIICFLSLLLSIFSILKHFSNYRKPNEQRLVIRILLLVPIFSITCLMATWRPIFTQLYLDFIREFYEAFVIFIFFSYLTLILGGERKIITELAMGKRPVRHAFPFMGYVDLSNPYDFLSVKRGILQYVWFKPFYCLGLLICQIWNFNQLEFWLLILYNASVTWSLYNLALFWKCLYDEVKAFNPWSKFLCVKVIIFASYWQGMIIKLLSMIGQLGTTSGDPQSQLYAYLYQNGLLCLEMIGFAILHAVAFPWVDYSIERIPHGARMKIYYALRDCFGPKDLIWDFKQTLFIGDTYYNFKNFDPLEVESIVHNNNSRTTMSRLSKGMRFTNTGRDTYWINYGSISDGNRFLENHIQTSNIEDEPWEYKLFDRYKYIPDDTNYPVVWNSKGHRYTRSMNDLRNELGNRSSV